MEKKKEEKKEVKPAPAQQPKKEAPKAEQKKPQAPKPEHKAEVKPVQKPVAETPKKLSKDEKAMLEKLKEVKARFETIASELEDPAVINNPENYKISWKKYERSQNESSSG